MAAEELLCAICLEVFVSPVTLTCGHTFDRECLYEFHSHTIESKGCFFCPICRVVLTNPETVFLQSNCVLIESLCARQHSFDLQTKAKCHHRKLHQRRLLQQTQQEIQEKTATFPRNNNLSTFLALPWNSIYGPEGVQSEEEVPQSTTFSSSLAGLILMFLLFSFVLDQFFSTFLTKR